MRFDLFLLQAGEAGNAASSFWDRNGDAIETLFVFAAGILFYGLVVNFFYQLISKRIMFGGTDTAAGRRVGGPLGGFVYLLMFPLVSFVFFLLLSMALLFLGGEEQNAQLTLTLGMAVVLAVRVAAYFSESTSHDVAKMLPLGLLGVMLVRAEILQLGEAVRQLGDIFDEADLVLLYFGIVVVVEYILRSVWLLLRVRRTQGPKKPGRPPRPKGAHGAEPRGTGPRTDD